VQVPKLELSSDLGFLACTYILVFLYISFSIGKFNMVKSKVRAVTHTMQRSGAAAILPIFDIHGDSAWFPFSK
jgi:hypothetical protein